ncbi:MAG: aminoacetone oxidase family FAD-binding enzyme [Bacteroidales bacterium]|nr:aminoacetone oxidase family FAD-binding enzyme [Bacteroidales bacterium]
MLRIGIIGAGAAGCFCAAELSRRLPRAQITVYEAGTRPLAKVSITGGGRCNFTNSFAFVGDLKEVYPRGDRLMKRALRNFSQEDCREWFLREGVESVVQDDQCVFPMSQDAMQIVRALERAMRKGNVRVLCNRRIGNISELDEDIKVVTTGGGALKLLDGSGIGTTACVPSLFTFKIPVPELTSLMGTTVPEVQLSIPGTGFRSTGILLVTDWGISGPASLRLSSYAARFLAENQYCTSVCINWLSESEQQAREELERLAAENPKKLVSGARPAQLSERCWKHILGRASLREGLRWAEMGSKGLNKLCNSLTTDIYPVRGRAKFKEEFVTCGGVSLDEINLNTLESKKEPGLFFAGEVLDLDAVTGGFNLQAAWSTGYTVAKSIAEKYSEGFRQAI